MNLKLSLTLFASVLFAACGGDRPAGPQVGAVHPGESAGEAAGKTAEHAHVHTERIALGEVKVGEHVIAVFQVVPRIEAGKEGDFDLDFPAGDAQPGKAQPTTILPGTVRGWIGVESAQGSMRMRFEKETATRMHGHPEAPNPIPEGSKLWLEVEGPAGPSKAAVEFKR